MSITIGEPGKIPGSPINYNLFFIMLKICIETMLFKLKEVLKFILKKISIRHIGNQIKIYRLF